ncbi:NAD regulator [Bosea sp. 2KB_26]|uniref:NUDIX hydrolase n=1 Tax=Bosea sp. 2KB_26 TaxID=3237475 RepID=UPI000DE1AF4E
MPKVTSPAIEIGLAAAIVAFTGHQPHILTAQVHDGDTTPGLPYGPFDPLTHRTFEIGLRSWVADQTALSLGYVEQLYTFGDRGRQAEVRDTGPHVVSVGYLALTRAPSLPEQVAFQPWYGFFPWEDWRAGRPAVLDSTILPQLDDWAQDKAAERAEQERRALSRQQRIASCFGLGGVPWDEEKTLERYELLYDAGLAYEALRDRRPDALPRSPSPLLGRPMRFDHRRILATAIGRLRAKLKYRPVVFELMPDAFTLTALQNTVEAISGRHLHKQNFRRLVESAALVEPTGTMTRTAGRPAALFRYRREVIAERPAPGLRVGGRSLGGER